LVALSLARRGGGIDPGDDFNTLQLHYAFLWISFAGFGFAIAYAQNGKKLEFPSQLFVMPAPAWLIVGCRTLQGVVTIAALFLLTATAYELFLGLNWPILGPVLFLSTGFVCLQAWTWSLRDFRLWKLGIYVPFVAASVYWLSQRYTSHGQYQPAEFWHRVTAGEVLTMAACAAGAFAVSVGGMARGRRGDATGAERIRQWLDRIPDLFSAGRRQHGSPEVALFRTAFWRHGVAMPAGLGAVMMGILLVSVILVAFGRIAPHESLKFLIMFPLVAISFLPLGFGALIGEEVRHNSTLPVSNSTQARALLRVGAVGCVTTWLICCAILLSAIAWVWLAEGIEVVERAMGLAQIGSKARNLVPLLERLGDWFVPFSLLLLCLTSWTFQGLGVFLSLLNRHKVRVGLTLEFVVIGWTVALVFLNDKLIGPQAAHLVRSGSAVVFGSLCLFGSACVWMAARRHQLVSQRAALSAVVVWLVLCGIVTSALFDVPTTSWGFMLGVCGALTLPLTPLASTPLAIRWQRHQ
jgi:hypothetical protein